MLGAGTSEVSITMSRTFMQKSLKQTLKISTEIYSPHLYTHVKDLWQNKELLKN